jgi:predicted nucleotidyltransferase
MIMPKKAVNDVFASSNSLIVLSFRAEHAGEEFLGSEIQQATKVSRAGVYLAGRELITKNLVARIEKGRFHLYSVRHDRPIVRQFKILKNIAVLEPLIEKMRPIALKIVLFGSTGRGEDTSTSDIDIFIRTFVPEKIRRVLTSSINERTIQAVITTPAEWPVIKEKNPLFADEIDRGIALWETNDEFGVQRLPEKGENQTVFQRKKIRASRAEDGGIRS